MAVRKPPTTAEVLKVLYRAERGRLEEGEFRALEWLDAIEAMRHDLRTTSTKAEEWLAAVLSEPDIPIAAVRPIVGSFVGIDASPGSLSQLGWSDGEIGDFQFTDYGSLAIPGSERASRRHVRAYIVKIQHLEGMRTLLARARGEVEAKRAAMRELELAKFHSLHGDALDVIRAVVDRVPGEDYLRHDLINARIHEGTGRFHGDDAVLTITLCGNQIDAFAAALLVVPELQSAKGDHA